jgi:integrase
MTNVAHISVDRRRSSRNVHVGLVTVFFRGASWHIYYREGGRPKRVRIGHDLDEAKRHAAEVNAQISHGLPSAFGFERLSVVELVEHWLEHHEYVLRSAVPTIRRYRSAVAHMTRFVEATSPRLTADAFDTRMAEAFVKHLRTTVTSPNGHPNAAKRTLRDKGICFILGATRALMNFAARQRHVPPYAKNPFSEIGVERMRIEDAKPIAVLGPEEEAAFLRACSPHQFRVFFTLGFTGMRPGELCHLLVDDVDVAARTLHIRNHPQLGWRTKTRTERRVFLFDELLAVLRDAIAGRASGPVFLAARFAAGTSAPMLAGLDERALIDELRRRVAWPVVEAGRVAGRAAEEREAKRLWRDAGALTPKRVRTEFMRVARRIGRPDLTCPKLWRHQMVTSMQSADVDLMTRKAVVGHTRTETSEVYTHVQDATLSAGMMKVVGYRPLAVGIARERLAATSHGSGVRQHA